MTMKTLALAAAPVALLAATPALAVDETFDSRAGQIRVQTFADGLVNPWAIAFLPPGLPQGGLLVTEKQGNLRHVGEDGALGEPISGVPQVDASRQGGLLDVTLDPDFEQNRLVYLSYAEPGDGGTNGTAVARGVLNTDMTALENVEVIFQQQPKVASNLHFGSRLVFDGQGHLYVTLGERSQAQFRPQAQDLGSHLGKIVRINPDGTVPDDNPFVGQAGALPEIYAYGIRNSQAAAINPASGALWEIEHGPRGGDELNVIAAGQNYGWPVATLGIEYSGDPINGAVERREGMVDAIHSWTPVIAPSGMIFYDGDAFAEWQGDLFVGGLASTALVRLDVNGDSVSGEERLLESLGLRIRDVAQGPDGAIYVATDEDNGEILRIAPAEQTGATK